MAKLERNLVTQTPRCECGRGSITRKQLLNADPPPCRPPSLPTSPHDIHATSVIRDKSFTAAHTSKPGKFLTVSTSDNADVSTTKMNDSGNSTSLSSENGLPTAETSANDLAPGFSITQPASAQTAGPSSTSTDSRDSSGSGSGKGSEKRSETTGPLLLCTTCPASFHLPCLRPRLRKMPEGQWSCAYCYATGRARGGDSDGACGAVRLMESLRQGVHGAVRVRFVFHIR